MQKHLLIVFSFMVCILNNVNASEWNTLQKVLAVGAAGIMLTAGSSAEAQNAKYSKEGTRPDWPMRLSKAVGAGAILFATDFLTNDTDDTKVQLCKLAAFTVSLFAITDTAGRYMRNIPILSVF